VAFKLHLYKWRYTTIIIFVIIISAAIFSCAEQRSKTHRPNKNSRRWFIVQASSGGDELLTIPVVRYWWAPVACRGLVMPGATAWLDAPLLNSSIEQWRRPMVVIVTGYTLFVTSQYDVIFTFANQCFGEVCWHNMHIQGRRNSGRGSSRNVEGNGNLQKTKKSFPIMFFSVHQQCWP